MVQAQDGKERSAPFIPFKTFLTSLQVLDAGLPERIDKTVFRTMAFNVQPHIVSALKWFHLIEEDGTVRPELERLKNEPDKRPQIMKELVEAHYSKVVELGAKNASEKELWDAIHELGAKGDETVRKCIAFYRKAAAYSGISLSTHWPSSKPGPRTGGGAVARKRTAARKPGRAGGPPPPANGTQAPTAKTVTLRSGGIVTLSATVDLLAMSRDDREWVIELIDKFRTYEEAPTPA